MILSQLLESTRRTLQENNIVSAKIDALIIICHDLSLSKEQVIFNHDLIVTKGQIDKVQSSISRRIKREPISHIIGKRSFYEYEFLVNKDVLDPRPDSEILIESVLKIFPDKKAKLKILELGVGSGCLVISILKKFSNSTAIGVDIKDKSLGVAKVNANNLKLGDRIKFINSNWFDKVLQRDFDLIISNPPYIKSSQIDNLQEEVRLFEPKVALDGGKEGLDCYEVIAKDVKSFLNKGGYLLLEIGEFQENDVIKIFTNNGLKFINAKKDLSGIIRCLIFQN